jgi:hypothetical protein
MCQMVWSMTREQVLMGLIFYARELTVEGLVYRHPFTAKLAKAAWDSRVLGGSEFVAETRGRSVALKKAKQRIEYGFF